MTTEFPKQTVAEAIQILYDRDEFKVIVELFVAVVVPNELATTGLPGKVLIAAWL